jgi:hypothetical protein
MFRQLFIIICIVFLNHPAHAEETVNWLLNEYSSNPDRRYYIETVVESIENGFGWANAELKVGRNQSALYCSPQKLALNGGQIMDILRRARDERKSIGEYSFGFGILEALKFTFPCDK